MQSYPQPAYIGQPSIPSVQIVQQPSQPTTTNNGERPGFAHRLAAALGCCEIVIGVLAIILGSVAIIYESGLYYIGTPIWCGVMMVITGLLGVLSAHYKTSETIVASMVMSIISASICGTVLLSMESISLAITSYSYCYYENCKEHKTSGMHATNVALSLIYAIIAIINSAFCCRAVCCGRSQPDTVVYYTPQNQVMPVIQPSIVYSHAIQPGPATFPMQHNVPPPTYVGPVGYMQT
ncbi:membrane-spanning 4-domains subfamily A member 8-like [Glandiceps talaboti]